MCQYTYTIVMDTQLGLKHGTIVLKVEGTKIEGDMYILGNKAALHGESGANGKCKLFGQIITRMRTLSYSAEGWFNDKKIDLMLREPSSNFHVSGVACSDEKGGMEIENSY